MRLEPLSTRFELPWVARPSGPDDPVRDAGELTSWAGRNRDWIRKALCAHGALLFRGYGFRCAGDFHAFARAVSSELLPYARGASPRTLVEGRVYTSTEAPSILPIAPHCEMSASGRSVPSRIFFFCEIPARHAGQTPICDVRRVYEALDPELRTRFESRGLRMIENVPEKFSWKYLGAAKTWPRMFETENRSEVESYCVAHGIHFRWKPDGAIQMINDYPAAIEHPESGAKVWLNAAHSAHFPTFAWELRRLELGPFVTGLYRFVAWHQRRGLAPQDRPIHVTFADGSEIPTEDVERIRRCYWDHAILFDWEQGDVLMLDNLRVAHGRMPFRGRRRVLVALAEPWLRAPVTAPRARA